MLELIAIFVQRKRRSFNWVDAISSLNAGSAMGIIAVALRGLDIMLYTMVYDKVCVMIMTFFFFFFLVPTGGPAVGQCIHVAGMHDSCRLCLLLVPSIRA